MESNIYISIARAMTISIWQGCITTTTGFATESTLAHLLCLYILFRNIITKDVVLAGVNVYRQAGTSKRIYVSTYRGRSLMCGVYLRN